MADRFQRHPATRLYGPDGTDKGTGKLAAALDRGCGFRIGLDDDPPPAPDEFETLTSGSTGKPRRIRRSVASWQSSFVVNADLFGIGPGTRIAVLGALEHSLSLYGTLEGACLGAEVHLLAGLRPDRHATALADRHIAVLYATPAQLRGLKAPLPALRLVLAGGSKLDAGLRAQLAQVAPQAEIREFYGAAETSFITLTDADTPEGSVGRAYPGVQTDIRDGEIWVKSPYLFTGYASDPGVAQWADGWLCVGEMGWIEDGRLFLSGRKGRMVTVADQNVFPEAIEALMEGLPGINRAAVLAEPDAARGQVLYAVAQGDPGTEGAVLQALRAALGPLKAPRRILWRADWPVTASGKTDLAALGAGG